MKTLHRALAAASAALLALTAGSALADPAQRWRHVGDGDGVMGFIDLASLSRSGDLARANVMIVRDSRLVTADSPLAFGVTTMEFDCKGKRDHMVYAHVYGATGATLAEGPTDNPMEDEDFNDPETVKLFGLICEGAPAPDGTDFPSVAATAAWAHSQRP